MSKVANIHDHERFEAAEAPPRPEGAQVEDRFVRISHEILTAAMQSRMTSREMKIFLAAVRATFGWHRSTARLSQQALAEMTGLPAKRCSEALNSLLRKRVLIREGGSRSPVGINTRVEDWNFEAQQARVTPKRQAAPKQGHRPQDGVIQRPQDGDTYKERKDITSPNGEESTAGADDANPVDQDLLGGMPTPEPAKARRTGLPPCPHQAILDLWAEVMPDKWQPVRSLWPNSSRARNLAARWKTGFAILNEQAGEPLYTDAATGLAWWGRFFRFLRRSEFLMRDDSSWFGLDWISKAENFEKILSMKYHGGDA
ncbi:replication protein [Halomonas sp. H10-9-1]|uniref:replication protein n=1 Tax=Halomonas sp. H10-9-1 TaxID=2950871 RepID=UPI0032DEFE1A